MDFIRYILTSPFWIIIFILAIPLSLYDISQFYRFCNFLKTKYPKEWKQMGKPDWYWISRRYDNTIQVIELNKHYSNIKNNREYISLKNGVRIANRLRIISIVIFVLILCLFYKGITSNLK